MYVECDVFGEMVDYVFGIDDFDCVVYCDVVCCDYVFVFFG